MLESYVIENITKTLESDQNVLSNNMIRETDDELKKDILKQLSAINMLIRNLNTYNVKYILPPPEEKVKEKKEKKGKKEISSYGINSMIN